MDDLEKQHRAEQDAIYKEQGSGTDQAAKLRELDRKQGDIKKQRVNSLEQERKEAIDKRKAELAAKYLAGADSDEQIREQLKALLGGDAIALEAMMNQADLDKAKAEQQLKERLAARRAEKEARLLAKKQEFEQDVENQDAFEVEEQEE